MAIWLQMIAGAFMLIREIFKYLSEVEESKQVRLEKMKEAKEALKHARSTKDTSKIESVIKSINLSSPSND